MATKLVNSIDAKSLSGNIKTLLKGLDDGVSIKLYSVVGKVDSIKTGESDKGPWTAFLGQFQSVVHNSVDGENNGKSVMSSKAFLQEPYQTMVFSALKDAEGGSVEIALDVSAKVDSTSSVGYVYDIASLKEIKLSDDLQGLRDLLPPAESVKLEAPKKGK